MNEALQNIALFFLIVFTIWVLSLIPYRLGKWVGYRDGQIDAINGAIYYKLEKQADSEFRWIGCPGICRYEKEEAK